MARVKTVLNLQELLSMVRTAYQIRALIDRSFWKMEHVNDV